MKKTLTFTSFLICTTCIFFTQNLMSQTTITLQPNAVDGKDAIIDSRLNNDNFGNHIDFLGMAWTYGGTPLIARSLIDFDWTLIPNGATINSARLSLYSYNSPANDAHSTLSGSNASQLLRVTSTWGENSVTWNTQPSTTNQNMVTLPMSTNTIQDYLNIDVKNIVEDIIADPTNSYGIMMKLENEQYYRSMLFASSDNSDSNLHPKLEITYTMQDPTDSCLTFRPNAIDGKDALIDSRLNNDNFGNHFDFLGMAWTYGGTPLVARSLIDFDWNAIPAGVTITSAELSLFSYNSPANDAHSTLSGSNASQILRVTSSWGENSVTWNNQPSTTNQNMVTLPMSTNTIQNYLDIDVKNIVEDIIADPNNSYGLMLKLENEQYYRSMLFASSDNTDPNLHPKLEVCYVEQNASIVLEEKDVSVKLYPNPFEDYVNVELTNINSKNLSFNVYDGMGNIVRSQNIDTDHVRFYKENLPSGIYFYNILDADSKTLNRGKLVIQ